MTCDVTMWTQNDVKSHKKEYLRRFFLYWTETLYSCNTQITKFHDKLYPLWHFHGKTIGSTVAPLHSKGQIRVFLLQEVFALVVHSVGVSEYKNYTAPAQESLLDSGGTNKTFFMWERKRSGNEYVAMVTS